MTLQKIMNVISKLELEDLKKVNQYTELLLSSTRVNSSDDWLLDGIIYELKNRGLGYTIPEYFKIKNRQQYKGYARKSDYVRSVLEHELFDPKKVELVLLGRRVAALLADYLQPNLDLSLDVLLGNIEKAPQAIEAGFPGYVSSGLLYLLLKPTKEWLE